MKNILNNKWVLVSLMFLIGMGVGYYLMPSASINNSVIVLNDEDHAHEHNMDENGLYTCAMHPQILLDQPGNCPICAMELIPVEVPESEQKSSPNEVPMSADAMKLAEVETYIVHSETPVKELRLLGKVKADERLMYAQPVHFAGRVEKLYINFDGEKVAKGQKIASIYSPELITAQRELLEVIKDSSPNPSLVDAAKGKLKQWHITDAQIAEIERSGLVQQEMDIYSHYNGYVVKRFVSEGDHVMDGTILWNITDLSKVWVMLDAYENDLPWIKIGQSVAVNFKAVPGKTYTAKVSFIDPFINPETRVARIRVEISNTQHILKPDMFAEGVLQANLAPTKEGVIVPKSAVLWTGKRAVVYVKVENREMPTFLYREIVLGEEAGNYYRVKSGLMEGEEIASNGVFRIDASAQLAGKKSMMNTSAKAPKKMNMPGM